jgi:hypothetical protein
MKFCPINSSILLVFALSDILKRLHHDGAIEVREIRHELRIENKSL